MLISKMKANLQLFKKEESERNAGHCGDTDRNAAAISNICQAPDAVLHYAVLCCAMQRVASSTGLPTRAASEEHLSWCDAAAWFCVCH
jgi:hypothetical protein